MWEVDPSTLISIAILLAGYVGASLLLKRSPTLAQGGTYAAGLFAILAVLSGPLDQFSKERSFFIYISQQMVLVFVAPPLLLAGTPDWMLRPILLHRMVEPLARILTRPLFAFLLFAAVFTLVHYPLVCDAVCHVHPIYGDVHTLLLTTGLLLWFPLLSPLPEYPRLSYPLQIMYLFLLMIPMTAVAAPITMAQSVIYTWYVLPPHPLGLSPMADQVLGGLIMWVGQGVYLMFVFSAIFFRWSRRDDEEMPPINRRAIPVRVLRQQPR
ncbi:MAG TPA: cytochrome c oxidase assembly protein [Candidatus Binataceae bacterium]|nr:cytochrome c oxidase assembly protein [Candidatus Binataceae bacterium]